MAAKVRFSTFDRLGKPSSMTLGAADAVTDAAIQALVDALDAVLLGSAVRGAKTTSAIIDTGSAVPPVDVNADRDRKWLLRIQDSTTAVIYTHEIGTNDSTQLPSASTDFLNLAAGTGLALKTAVDAMYRSPDGNTGVLLSVQQVSRTESS